MDHRLRGDVLSQILNPGSGGGITEVTHDATLTGNGAGTPLSVVNNYASTAQGALADTALQTVAVDGVTITGTGVIGDPLIASGGGGGTYAVAKTVFSNGAVPPYTAPVTAFPTTDATWFTPDGTLPPTTDVDFNAGFIRFNTAGTYRVSMQFTFTKQAAPSHEDLQLTLGLTDAAPNPPIMQSHEYSHFESGDTGTMSVTFSQVIQASAGMGRQPTFIIGGSPGAVATLDIGFEDTYIIVERVA